MGEAIMLSLSAVVANITMLEILHFGTENCLIRKVMSKLKSNRGEVNPPPVTTPPGGDAPKTFTQDQVNHLLAEHKRGLQNDVDMSGQTITDLQTKLKKFEDAEANKTQADLEAQKNYDELKKGWESKEGEYKNVLSEKDITIRGMRIDNALTNEIIKQNAHSDTVQLIKALAEIDDKGVVTIKGKNASGVEDSLSVEEGVKAYLKDRPHLVKAAGPSGGGTLPPGSLTPGGNVEGSDPMQDARDLEVAMRSGDRKKITEIKAKIAAKRATVPQSQPLF